MNRIKPDPTYGSSFLRVKTRRSGRIDLEILISTY